jgi:hypothetical protein
VATVAVPQITGDVKQILHRAPEAVESFSPGHWQLLCRLERDACDVVRHRDIAKAVTFFVDVAYAKRPHEIDREKVRQALEACPFEVSAALDALVEVHRLDYEAMEVVARLPYFGRHGGRSFNSAVLRLVCPDFFGIVDWRNVAVLCGVPGFEGLVRPAMVFPQFSQKEILDKRGNLPFTRDVYRTYNDTLRSLAAVHAVRTADIDLVLWTYSIQRRPFVRFVPLASMSSLMLGREDREALRRDHRAVSTRLLEEYLTPLREVGMLDEGQIRRELCSIFTLIRDECAAFGRNKRGKLKDRLVMIISVLDEAIASRSAARLLGQWDRWQSMVDTSAPQWKGINLPADMIFEGYLVLEDFIPVKEYIESYHDGQTFEPRLECD